MSKPESFFPEKNDLYVEFGHFNDIKTILKSKIFYPTFITGLSGNGKTMMVEQICASLKREMFRVNITIETDEDDLLGGFRLENGSTVWFDGPVINAMRRGAVLLLDEVDLASSKIMCLQPVLEGKGIFLKKINQFVAPAKGFTIVATANTKGQGSDSGKFIGTNILNEAFLERFPVTFEQEYPPEEVEKTILENIFELADVSDSEYITLLLKWANDIRKTFSLDGISDVISTRRLVHIAQAYIMFKDRKKALEICINRFDETTKTAFKDLYDKFEEKPEQAASNNVTTEKESGVVPEDFDLGSLLQTKIASNTI